ncbi:MAG TPA: hypothetical protein VL334_07345, partial [Anaerolineae bacterium]|nr:hypothetical protein [Anaerolineae bacterium]
MTDQPNNNAGNGSGSRRPEQPLFTMPPQPDRSTAARVQRKAGHELKQLRQAVMGPIKWAAYESGQTRLVPPPDRMYIESTNVCNLDCVMCP